MGKEFTARFSDGSERFAASFSMGRAALFVDITHLLEKHLALPSGIANDPGNDEHVIDPDLFIAFFERFWDQGWLGEHRSGFLHGWAQHAAGMIENITRQSREWIDRNGEILEVRRYLREGEKGRP